MDKLREEFKDIAEDEEDILNLALFPQVAPTFIENRKKAKAEAEAEAARKAAAGGMNLKVSAADGPDGVRELYVEYKA